MFIPNAQLPDTWFSIQSFSQVCLDIQSGNGWPLAAALPHNIRSLKLSIWLGMYLAGTTPRWASHSQVGQISMYNYNELTLFYNRPEDTAQCWPWGWVSGQRYPSAWPQTRWRGNTDSNLDLKPWALPACEDLRSLSFHTEVETSILMTTCWTQALVVTKLSPLFCCCGSFSI